MSKVRIGTKVYHDQLASLSGLQLRDAVESAQPHYGSASSERRGAYAPARPVAIEVKQLGGDVRRLVAKPTDLTADGFGCLVGLYLYPGQDCTVHLVTLDGEHVTVTGRTENCVFLGNRAHFLGILFDRPLDLDLFFPPEPRAITEDLGGVRWIARLMERLDGNLDHPLRDDFVMILRAEAARLAGEESMLSPEELQTPDRIAVLSYNGNILAVNPAWLLFAVETGYDGGSFQKQNYLRVLEAHRDSCQTVGAILDAVEATIEGEGRECRYAYRCHDTRGEAEYFSVRHGAEMRMSRRVLVVRHLPLDGDAVASAGEPGGAGGPVAPAA
jgi:PAS domain-containing protein